MHISELPSAQLVINYNGISSLEAKHKMPFQNNFASKVVLVIASLLVHHALVARCAPPGPLPEAMHPVNPSSGNATSNETPLLDESKLPFLSNCNADIISGKLCDLYRSLATTVLTQRKPEPVTVDEVQKVIAEKMDANNFCDNLSPVLRNRKAKHPELTGDDSPLEKEVRCSLWCVTMNDDMTDIYVKPICKVLLWGFRQEVLAEVLPEDPAKKVATSVVVPPMPVESGNLPEVVKNDVSLDKPAESAAVQPNISDPEKPVQNQSGSKANGAEDTKVSVADAAVVNAPSNSVAVKSQATTVKAVPTVSSVQQKPAPSDKENPDEDDLQVDANEEQNQHNLNDINNEEGLNNIMDNGEEYGDEDETEQQSILPKESPVKEGSPLGGQDVLGSRDSDGFSVEQPAASAVQIERVDPFFDQDDSNFFSYFMFMMFACIVCYVAYHNKSKLLALLVEGRRSNSGRGGFSKGRKHTAAYRKLDSNLEEAITSNASASSRSTSQIIY